MTEGHPATALAVLGQLSEEADYRDAEKAFVRDGWTPGGVGDWAFAMRSPDGTIAARISPFDPTGPYSAALYMQAAHTRQVPRLFAHRRLSGGGDLQLLEWLEPVGEDEARAFQRAITLVAPEVAGLVAVIRRVHAQARSELPWCGPLDDNPANVMRTSDGRLVVTDLFYADGPNLYATAWSDPDRVVSRIPEVERRFMTEIPSAHSGPWDKGSREEMRELLRAADPRRVRTLRQQIERRLERLDGLLPGESMFGHGRAFWANGKEVVHFQEETTVQVRLTRPIIRERIDELRADPRVELRSRASDWIRIHIGAPADADFVVDLAMGAEQAHRPPPGVPAKAPPTGADLARRQRFH